MLINKSIIPIGPVLLGSVAYVLIVYQISNIFYEYKTVAFIGLILFSLMIFIVWLKNTQVLLNEQVELWCVNKEPNLYREYGNEVVYLKNAKVEYVKWIRRNWRIPNEDVRKKKFNEIIVSLTNKTAHQLIASGLNDLKNKSKS